MQDHQIETVRISFAQVAAIASQAAALFYDNLFSADATLKPLFRGDMVNQGERLMAMIGSAVKLLDQPAKLIPVLQSLGQRHAGYGVQNSHCATVGGALLKTLEQGLGAAYTEPVKLAWTEAYGLISSTMMAGRLPVLAGHG